MEKDIDRFLEHVSPGDTFKKHNLLATGRFGAVYYMCTAGPKQLVVKQYTQRLDEAEREYLLVKKLQHHRTIKYIGMLKLDTSVIIEMKCLTTLKSLLKSTNKPFSEQEAILYGRQTAEGLLYLHKRRLDPVVHRAIRCSHLLLNDARELRIGGFFLARPLLNARATVDDANMQDFTRESTPPEILSAKPHGLPVDIWQLGYALVEMLTCDEKIGHLDTLSDNVRHLVLHLLNENPSARPTIEKALAILIRISSHEVEDSVDGLNIDDMLEVDDSVDGPQNDVMLAALTPVHKKSAATDLYEKMRVDNKKAFVADSLKAEQSPSAVEMGQSALHLLCRADSKTDDREMHRKTLSTAQELIKKSMSKVTKPDKDGQTPVHVACLSGNVEMVQLLVDNSDFLPVNHHLQTPIHLVARSDSENGASVAEVLLQNVAEHSDLPTDVDEETPLQTAARHGNAPVAKVLLEELLRRLASGNGEQLHNALEQKSVDGETALFTASCKGYPDIVRMLLAHGADPNVNDARGMLPHEIAVVNMDLDVMKALLERPAPACDTVPLIPATKETLLKALKTAKSFDDIQIIELLEKALSVMV